MRCVNLQGTVSIFIFLIYCKTKNPKITYKGFLRRTESFFHACQLQFC